MNVTTIGFPFSAPATPGSGVDAGTIAGFADLVGGAATQSIAAQGFAGAPAASTLPVPAPVLTAQTNTPILPTADVAATAAQRMPGDKPQVAMAQLLATAAPSAVVAAPVAPTGDNPLAAAVAQALAKPETPALTPSATSAPALAALPDATPPSAAVTTPDAATPPSSVPMATPSYKPVLVAKDAIKPAADAAQLIPIGAIKVDAATAQPAADAVALNPGDVASLDAPTLEKTKAPGKSVQKPASADAAPDPAGAILPAPDAIAPPQVSPVPQPQPQPQIVQQAIAPVTQDIPSDKPASAAVSAKPARGGTPAIAAPFTNASPTEASATEIASAITANAQGESKTGGEKGDASASFGQQVATDSPRAAHAAATPASFAAMVGDANPTTAASRPLPVAAPVAEPVLQARPGELGRSLGVEIARKVEAGEDTLRVRLNPAELGRVEVTLAFDRDGRVQATMRAESQHTLDLLRQDAPDLGRALQQAGIRNDAQSFRFEGRDGGSNGNGNGQSAFQQQSRGGNQQFRDEPEPQAAAYRPIRGDGQVDLIA